MKYWERVKHASATNNANLMSVIQILSVPGSAETRAAPTKPALPDTHASTHRAFQRTRACPVISYQRLKYRTDTPAIQEQIASRQYALQTLAQSAPSSVDRLAHQEKATAAWAGTVWN